MPHLFWYNAHGCRGSDFCATNNFPGTLVHFCFMVFTQVFMKVLARILIHDGSLQLQSVFKMLLPICLAIVEKELCIQLLSRHFQNRTSVTVLSLIQVSFATFCSKQENKDKHSGYHGRIIPFESQVYSKHMSSIFLLFSSSRLVRL